MVGVAVRRARRPGYWHVLLLAGLVLLLASGGYLAYAGYEGSRQLVFQDARVCVTPAQLGWAYEAINYDQADDLRLAAENVDMTNCADQGTAGDEVVSPDGTRLDGWYIPAAKASGLAPTILVVHGHEGNKSDMLYFGWVAPLHDRYNTVVMDLRGSGRSGDSLKTVGLDEQDDVGAMLDWLESTKGVDDVGVIALSAGAAAALARARTDDRIKALVLDSVHAHAESFVAARVRAAGHPAYPATWAVMLGFRIRTGRDINAVDPIGSLAYLRDRPILLLHGTADMTDLPSESAELMYAEARRLGFDVALEYCEGAGQAGVVSTCPAEYARWTRAFLGRVFGRASRQTPAAPLPRSGPSRAWTRIRSATA